MTNLAVLITDYRDTDGTIGATMSGLTPTDLGEPINTWIGTDATIAASPAEGIVSIVIGTPQGDVQAVVSEDQFHIAMLAVTDNIEEIEEMIQ